MTTLHLGDCFAGLAALDDRSVDHVVCDPPFDSKTHRVAGRTRSLLDAGKATELGFAALTAEQIGELGRQFARVARRWIVVWGADRQLEQWARALETGGARVVRFGVVVRMAPMPQVTGDRPGQGADLLVIAHAAPAKGERMRWNGGGKPAVWNALSGARDFDGTPPHPTVKSLDLMRKLLLDFTDLGDLVCDPFAGSGSTAVACQREGRRFVGWEIDPRYHAAALARLGVAQQREQSPEELGRRLLLLRQKWPARGPAAKGWGEELRRLGIGERTARRYMERARVSDSVSENDEQHGDENTDGPARDTTDFRSLG